MATAQQKIDKVQVLRKTKIETTFEYVPILGEILGYWRKAEVCRLGEKIEIHCIHTIGEFDSLYINGKEININNLK